MPEVFDLSNLGGERERVRLPDGEEYEILGASDLGPVLGARLSKLAKVQAAEDSDVDPVLLAERVERATREQVKLVCPSIAPEVADSLPFQVAAGVMARFMLGVKEMGGMAPPVQTMYDTLNPEKEAETEEPEPETGETETGEGPGPVGSE